MIYLIGGAPRCGKTTLAKMLAEANGFGCISTDELASAIKPYIPAEEYAQKLPMHVAWKEADGNNDIIYSRNTPEHIAASYLVQAQTYWPGIRNVLVDAVYDQLDYIVEGYQITPEFVTGFVAQYPNEVIIPLFLYKHDISLTVEGLKANAAAHDWVAKYSTEDSTYESIARMISCFGERTKEEADKHGYRSVKVDTDFYPTLARLSEGLLLLAQPSS